MELVELLNAIFISSSYYYRIITLILKFKVFFNWKSDWGYNKVDVYYQCPI